ncbi:MAG TPA: SEC-C metal-binding domain-containing protein [Acidimicrobiales bacterium]|nr:SEC-C metal-binding domain-containing protein [Acidimicrobiales bacterium]
MATGARTTDGRPGRNEACPCGSGRKVKRCCGLRRGPSESDLARGWLAEQTRAAARVLRRCDEDTLADLIEQVVELPTVDLSLQLPLPRLLSPELERARTALAEEDAEGFLDTVPAAVARVDTWPVRAALARAVLARRDAGALGAELAAAAIIELDSSSRRFLAASLLEALAVHAGTAPTPGGLVVVAS